jgi:Alg9-like mannosyltransferase family
VLFSHGFFMHDDHFLTVEPAASWAVGKNAGDYMPGIGNDRISPEPLSFFYLGFLFVFFKILYFLGIENPDSQMYFMRLLHGLYSLLTIYFAFKITEKLSNRKNAIQVGLLLALIAVLPNFSVRNLVEMVCIPPLLAGFWLLLRQSAIPPKSQVWNWNFIGAALVMGLAVGVRFQTGLLVALVGFVLLVQRGFWSAVVFGIMSFSAFFLTQIDDVLLWGGKPFQHLQGYFSYNTKNANNYPGSPIAYISFIALYILPPVSLFLLFGFFRQWKKNMLIFLPVLGFLIFHILYPNRQERFILPALPFVVMLGVIGWNDFVAGSKFWERHKSLLRSSYIFFWTINAIVLLVFSFTYGKRARVEAMLYLYEQGDCANFVREATQSDNASMPPQFYSGTSYSCYYYWTSEADVDGTIEDFPRQEKESSTHLQKRPIPNYYLFYGAEKLGERVARIQRHFPTLQYKTTIEAGWFDKLINRLNKLNAVETIYIYKVE